MSKSLEKSINGLQKALKVFDRLMRRLPQTYPQAHLVIHRDGERLKEYHIYITLASDGNPDRDAGFEIAAFCDPDSTTIHLSMDVQNMTVREIASLLLHEIGHLFAFQKYKKKNGVWQSEKYANDFASRWMRRLTVEGWF